MEKKEFDLLSLGEILLRLSPPNNERIVRGYMFEKQVGGAELNVASGVSLLGLRSGIISRIPDSSIGVFAKNKIRFCGVSDDYLVYDNGRDACRKTGVEMIKRFKEAGALISFDVNFRLNLWSGEEARECIEGILPYVDIFFCSEDTARLTFGKEGIPGDMPSLNRDEIETIIKDHNTVGYHSEMNR